MSFAGNMTFKNAQPLRDALAVAPAGTGPGRDRTPRSSPRRRTGGGGPMPPYLIPVTLRAMAAVKGLDEDTLAEAIADNTARASTTERGARAA